MKIAVLDDYQRVVPSLDAFRRLTGRDVTVFDERVDAASLAPFQALVLIRERTRVDAAFLAALPELKLISQTGRACAHIDLAACAARGVAVAAEGAATTAAAELTFALMQASFRDLVGQAEAMKRGAWQTGCGRALAGRRLGILGFGRIGSRLAGYAQAFGMRVCTTSPRANGVEVVTRERLFAESDAVALTLRLTPETRGSVTLEDLSRMKPDAVLVNTARAELVVPGALLQALAQGRPGYAALDVFELEPLTDSPLLAMPNVLCTPHLGYAERDTLEDYLAIAFDQVLAFERGEPINLVT